MQESPNDRDDDTKKEDDEDDDPLFEMLWRRVLDGWDDEKTHKALLEYAVRSEQLADAAGRYRALESDPLRRERAKQRLDAIVTTATQMMFAMKTPALPTTPRLLNGVVGAVSAVVLMWLAYVILRR